MNNSIAGVLVTNVSRVGELGGSSKVPVINRERDCRSVSLGGLERLALGIRIAGTAACRGE